MAYRPIPDTEKDQRYRSLRAIMERENLKLLLFTAVPQIGTKRGKGSLPYLFGYNLNQHRIVYASFPLEGPPLLIFPNGVSQGAKNLPKEMYRSAHWKPLGIELERVMIEAKVGPGDRVGVVGFDQQMPIQDYLYLTKKFPSVEFFEATALYDEVRALKSPLEISYLQNSAKIADLGFERLRKFMRIGVSIREIASEVFYEVFQHGSHFYDNSMLALWGSGGRCDPYIVLPDSDYRLKTGDMLIFSIELAGPYGYWVEHARIISLGPASPLGRKLAETATEALRRAAARLVPHTTCDAVYTEMNQVINKVGFHQGHAPGHGIGLDVAESPSISADEKKTIKDGMAIALHPHVLDSNDTSAGYVANTYVIINQKPEALSKIPLELIEI